MPVKKDASGRRSVEAEVSVPGTPEEVWAAIATGPGISSWFVPTELEEREGGKTISHFGPGSSMDAVATIKTWEPPHRFVADNPDDMGPGSPSVATEWIVEARSGGTCVVRVVHSWFASTDEWDNQFEQHEHGWKSVFRILRLYLTHWTGQRCSAFQLMSISKEDVSKTWEALTRPLSLAGAALDQRVSTPAGAPPLAGVVESVGPAQWPELLVRLDDPAPGIAALFTLAMGGQVFVMLRFFLFGDQAPDAAPRAESAWQAWLNERFPPPTGASPGAS